jgi:hypothetical protein
MDSDRQQTIHLEVTVPHILFSHRTQVPNPALEQQTTVHIDEGGEQVRLEPLTHQQEEKLPRSEERQPSMSESSSHILHSVPFQVFRLSKIPVQDQGQEFLCQILRQHSASSRHTSKKLNATSTHTDAEHFSVTDELAFSVEFRHTDTDSATETGSVVEREAASIPVPGLNRIVIYLNSEGTPDSYSIDGAES